MKKYKVFWAEGDGCLYLIVSKSWHAEIFSVKSKICIKVENGIILGF